MAEPFRKSRKVLHKLIRPILELACAIIHFGDAVRILLNAVCQLTCAFVHLRDAVRVLPEASGQFREVFDQFVRSVLDLFRAVIDLGDAISVFFDAVCQLLSPVVQFTGAVARFNDPVRKFTGAVRKIISVLLKILHLLIHVMQDAFVILVRLFIVIEKPREHHRHAGAHLELCCVQRDIHGIRDLNVVHPVLGLLAGLSLFQKMLRVILDDLEAVSQSRESHADHNGILALGDDGSVVHLDVPGVIIGEDDPRHCREGDIDVLILLCIFVVDMDPDLAGLSCQVLRRDLLSIQIIRDLLGDRRLFVRRPLVIDIVARGIPCQNIAALRERLVSLDVLDVLQDGVVVELVRAVLILEPAGYGHTLLPSGRIRKDVDGLLFLRAVRLILFAIALDGRRQRCRQVFLRHRLHRFALIKNTARDGCRQRRAGRHGHIRCHRRCQQQCKNLFPLHNKLLYILRLNGELSPVQIILLIMYRCAGSPCSS